MKDPFVEKRVDFLGPVCQGAVTVLNLAAALSFFHGAAARPVPRAAP